MSDIVLTFPILAGKVEAWQKFCQELSGHRRKSYEASRLRMGITYERLALVETSYGATAVTTLEAADMDQALGQIITSELQFDVWYREQLQELYGINLAGYIQFEQRALLPEAQEVHFEWPIPIQKNQPHKLLIAKLKRRKPWITRSYVQIARKRYQISRSLRMRPKGKVRTRNP